MKHLQLSCLLIVSQVCESLGFVLHAAFPPMTRIPFKAEPSNHIEAPHIEGRAISTELSTCGYLDGDPDKPRTADQKFNCRVDTKNGLWGFCPTTVLTASDCGLAGACVDGGSCSDGCGMTDSTDLTTFTCDRKSFCSIALLTFGVDQTYSYIACGAKATIENYLVTPIEATTTTTEKITEQTTSQETTSSVVPTETTSSTVQAAENTSTDTTSSSSEDDSSKDSPNNLGAIIGGVLGGLVVICATVIIAIFLLRRNRRKDAKGDSHEQDTTKRFWTRKEEVKEPQELEGYNIQEMPVDIEHNQRSPVELAG